MVSTSKNIEANITSYARLDAGTGSICFFLTHRGLTCPNAGHYMGLMIQALGFENKENKLAKNKSTKISPETLH